MFYSIDANVKQFTEFFLIIFRFFKEMNIKNLRENLLIISLATIVTFLFNISAIFKHYFRVGNYLFINKKCFYVIFLAFSIKIVILRLFAGFNMYLIPEI